MNALSLVETGGYFLGTVLHLVLLRLIARRASGARRRGEALFALLAVALLVWNAGNFLAAFAAALFGRRVPSFERWCDLVALVGLAATPSLLLHVLAVYLTRDRPAPLARKLFYVLYVPFLAFLAASEGLISLPEIGAEYGLPIGYRVAFAAWLVGALAAAAGMAFELSRRAERRPEAHPGTARFYRALTAILAATAALTAGILWLGRHHGPEFRTRLWLEPFIVLASTAPTTAIAASIYRYYALRDLLRRGLIYLVLGLAVVLLYLWGVSSLSRALEAAYGLNARVIEALFIIGIVFVFHPFRRSLQAQLASLIAPIASREATLLRQLAKDLARPGVSSPPELAARVAVSVERALDLERCALLVAPARSGGPIAGATPPGWIPYGRLLARLHEGGAGPGRRGGGRQGERAAFAPSEVADAELARELEAAGVEATLPLRYEGGLVGALVLGRPKGGGPVDPEAAAAVFALAGPLAVAAAGARLFDETLALERRLREEEKLASLGRLSASVAHRVKNPLSSIKALAQSLREGFEEGDRRRSDLGVVVEEVDQLAKVVHQLLAFARGDRTAAAAAAVGEGAAAAQAPPVDVAAVAADVALLFHAQAAAQGVEIKVEAAEGLPRARVERGELREVVANLIENALQAMPKGGEARIAVSGGPSTSSGPSAGSGRAGGVVSVEVTDTGPGIAPELRDKVFEPYFTTRVSGTGLGLAIVKQRVEGWGGRVVAAAPANGRPGARFVLELPAED